ncbi:MAG: HlyD family efflux transporter periplasmic adaptor subunit [Bacteroidales bacterium]|nr:HlyD family efflux transporter periplasmic adaptor subunit [Bacteroidales bacterium]
MDNNHYEIRSIEVQEILGNVPRWMVRWGTLLIFFVLIVLLVVANTLKYPDIIRCPIQLTTNTPPAEIKANVSGTIESFFVSDKQNVKKNTVLASIKSATNYADAIYLTGILSDSFAIEKLLTGDLLSTQLELGPMQPSYATFINTLEEYKNFSDIGYYIKKMNSLNSEIAKYGLYLKSLEELQAVLSKEYQIVEQKYKRDSALAASGVLSLSELETSEQGKLNKLSGLKESISKYNQTKILASQLEHQRLELELQLRKEDLGLYSKLKSRWAELKGALTQWANNYLIIAPFDGTVSMNKIWSEKQYIKQGEIAVTILPQQSGKIFGRVSFEPTGAGKIAEGNRVIIQFDNYPHLEFGIVTGRIETLSLTSEDGLYYARVSIDSTSLVTNYNQKLAFSQNMQGNAEIITESRTLLERIFAPVKSSISKQSVYVK